MPDLKIHFWRDIVEALVATRFIDCKASLLHSAAKKLGTGCQLTGEGGRAAACLGKHLDPDCLGGICWRIAKCATQEAE